VVLVRVIFGCCLLSGYQHPMSKVKNPPAKRKLPNHIRNLLRGSRSPHTLVSQLREQMEPATFPSLVDALPMFPHRGYPLLPSLGMSLKAFRTTAPLMNSVPTTRELDWAAAVFIHRAGALNAFFEMKNLLENYLLLGQYDECEKSLDRIEEVFGFSFWLLELRIAVLQLGKGLEAQKNYLASVRKLRSEGSLISFLGYYASWRNEGTVNPFHYKKTTKEKAADWKVPKEFRTYLLFKLTNECELSEAALSTILRYEASYSLIDYYESYVQLAVKFLSRELQSFAGLFRSSLLALADALSDKRLFKLLSITDNIPSTYLSRCKIRSLDTDCEILIQNSTSLQNKIERQVRENPDDIHLWYNGAIAEIDSEQPLFESNGLGRKFARILKAVIEKKSDLEERRLEGARLILNFPLPSVTQFEAFFWPQISSNPHPNLVEQLAAFLSSPYLDPRFLRSIPSDRRPRYAEELTTAYGAHQVLEFEAWRAGIVSDPNVQNLLETSVSPALFKEVLIEHSVAADRNDEALKIAKQLVAQDSSRYRHVAERWIAECLFKLERVEEAINYVCLVSISDSNVIPVMPLAKCATSLNKALRARLASKLSTPIVLDLYTRNFEMAFESERNYAYEDFLTAHGLEKPSQLKELVSQFERTFLIYYLQYVCVPEVMQVSTVFSSSRELDEERLAICAILAEIDPENLEEHEMEIREMTRKLVVRRGVREVEQSKIFVDMAAIRRWAEKSLKESFVRYGMLSSAGLDAGGAGIDNAIRDMLTGTPVSEEYLHLPKNETSDLLVNMINDFFQQCLMNPSHGLDCYLSMRIRHGALAGQLRVPLEEERIITRREGPLDEYQENEYWKVHISASPAELDELDERMREFSKEFDSFVDQIANDYIQIRSAEKPHGLFQLQLNALTVRALASDISKSNSSFEDFLDICADLFWQVLEFRLKDVRQTIEERVKPGMTLLFETFRTDLKKLQEPFMSYQLDGAIVNAQTKAQQALEQVKDWFRVPKPLTESTFTFEEIVDISLGGVRNLHRDFNPDLSVKVPADLFRLGQLGLFSDIFFIVLDNVRTHSGMSDPWVKVSARLDDAQLEIEVVSEVASNSYTVDDADRVSQIKETIAQGEGGYLRAVRSEGGTGLKKLRNILRREGSPTNQPEFGFLNNTFFVRFSLPYFGDAKAGNRKSQDA